MHQATMSFQQPHLGLGVMVSTGQLLIDHCFELLLAGAFHTLQNEGESISLRQMTVISY